MGNRAESIRYPLRIQNRGNLNQSKISKSARARPVFYSMMEPLYKGEANGILCWKLDRLARNPVDGGSIIWAMKQHGVMVITPFQTYGQSEDNVVWMYLEFGMPQKYVDDLSRNVKRGLWSDVKMGTSYRYPFYPKRARIRIDTIPNIMPRKS